MAERARCKWVGSVGVAAVAYQSFKSTERQHRRPIVSSPHPPNCLPICSAHVPPSRMVACNPKTRRACRTALRKGSGARRRVPKLGTSAQRVNSRVRSLRPRCAARGCPPSQRCTPMGHVHILNEAPRETSAGAALRRRRGMGRGGMPLVTQFCPHLKSQRRLCARRGTLGARAPPTG